MGATQARVAAGPIITVSFHRLAADEFRKARAWYAARDQDVAGRFVQSVDAAIERICREPGSHPIERKKARWVRVRRFPYRLIFEIGESGKILIIAVAHSSRRPRYWRQRN